MSVEGSQMIRLQKTKSDSFALPLKDTGYEDKRSYRVAQGKREKDTK